MVHNLDTEQTGSQIYDTQVLHASSAWLQGHMDQWHKLLGVPYTSFRAIPSVFPGAVVIVTKCGRIVRKVRLLVRFRSTARTFRTTHFVSMAVVVYSVKTQLTVAHIPKPFSDCQKNIRLIQYLFHLLGTHATLML